MLFAAELQRNRPLCMHAEEQICSATSLSLMASSAATSGVPAAASLGAAGHVAECVFCQLSVDAAADAGTRIIYADEHVFVVPDHRPAARLHLLVITRAHVRDCNDVLAQPQLMAHVRRVGEQMLQKHARQGEQQRLGFHVPPWISVPHLHLHVLAGNFRGPCSGQCACCSAEHCFAPCDCLRLKYTPCCFWYRSIDEQQRRIESLHLTAPPPPQERMQTEV